MGELLLHYGFLIAPITFLWVWIDKQLWHTRLFQVIRTKINVPPDLRGRWEGTLENADGTGTQQMVLEITQTLTHLRVHAYSSIAQSSSIITDIATDLHEEQFTLCFLWLGSANVQITDIDHPEAFYGYTMLKLEENGSPRSLKGFYFTNRRPHQTRGGIQLQWVSHEVLGKI